MKKITKQMLAIAARIGLLVIFECNFWPARLSIIDDHTALQAIPMGSVLLLVATIMAIMAAVLILAMAGKYRFQMKQHGATFRDVMETPAKVAIGLAAGSAAIIMLILGITGFASVGLMATLLVFVILGSIEIALTQVRG